MCLFVSLEFKLVTVLVLAMVSEIYQPVSDHSVKHQVLGSAVLIPRVGRVSYWNKHLPFMGLSMFKMVCFNMFKCINWYKQTPKEWCKKFHVFSIRIEKKHLHEASKDAVFTKRSSADVQQKAAEDDGKDEELGKAVMPYEEVSQGASGLGNGKRRSRELTRLTKSARFFRFRIDLFGSFWAGLRTKMVPICFMYSIFTYMTRP